MAAPPPPPPAPARASDNTPSPPTIMQRFVLANQELARHNARVSKAPPNLFPPFLCFPPSPQTIYTQLDKRAPPPLPPPSAPLPLAAQLRQELSEARRRADVATNAEKQTRLLQRIQNEEAARLKKQLVVGEGLQLSPPV